MGQQTALLVPSYCLTSGSLVEAVCGAREARGMCFQGSKVACSQTGDPTNTLVNAHHISERETTSWQLWAS